METETHSFELTCACKYDHARWDSETGPAFPASTSVSDFTVFVEDMVVGG